MATRKVPSRETKEYKVFPSAHSIKKSGFFDIDIDGKVISSSKTAGNLPRGFSVSDGPTMNLDDFDSFLEYSMCELDRINASRRELKAAACEPSFSSGDSIEASNGHSWEDAIVDCQIELSDEPCNIKHLGGTIEGYYNGCMDSSFYHSFTRKCILYDPDLQDEDDRTYRPSSNGLHSSNSPSGTESYDFCKDVSPTRCFSRISKRTKTKPQHPSRVSDQWKTQTITPLTDKAIASAFTRCADADVERIGYDDPISHFQEEDVSRVTKGSTKLTHQPKGDWTPRDIKMCSPFKACRGEASKATKSGGPIYGEGTNHEVARTPDILRSPLDGVYMVTADSDSDVDVDSYEHLYKAELDLLVERREPVDLQEMEEWLHQAGLTSAQRKRHRMAFDRLLKLNCKYFGKRIYPYRGEFDSMASKSLHILESRANHVDQGLPTTKTDKCDLKKARKRPFMDNPNVTESIPQDRTSGSSVNIATIPICTYRLFDYEAEPRLIRNPVVKAAASNGRQLYNKNTSRGFIKSPSIGLRHAISDFQEISPSDEDLFRVPPTLKQLYPALAAKDIVMASDATPTHQRNFILKVLLRFPFLDLKQFGLTSF